MRARACRRDESRMACNILHTCTAPATQAAARGRRVEGAPSSGAYCTKYDHRRADASARPRALRPAGELARSRARRCPTVGASPKTTPALKQSKGSLWGRVGGSAVSLRLC
eukprot:COSAG02_NODE_763_length_17431_cov_18.031502_4_plen_111_part_00